MAEMCRGSRLRLRKNGRFAELKQFQQNEEIVLQVIRKEDATEKLEEKIPYGLAVTLEAAEESQISVYEKSQTTVITADRSSRRTINALW